MHAVISIYNDQGTKISQAIAVAPSKTYEVFDPSYDGYHGFTFEWNHAGTWEERQEREIDPSGYARGGASITLPTDPPKPGPWRG